MYWGSYSGVYGACPRTVEQRSTASTCKDQVVIPHTVWLHNLNAVKRVRDVHEYTTTLHAERVQAPIYVVCVGADVSHKQL